MRTRATSVFLTLFAVSALVAVACGGGGSSSAPSGAGGSGGSTGGTGTGGNGSGGSGGSGGGGSAGSGGSGGGGGATDPGGSDGGATMQTLGCAAYVTCLTNAMSDADATTCDNTAKDEALDKLDAIDTCVGNFCVGMNGGTARCKADATSGDLTNLDGTPAFDPTTGDPKGDCGTCLTNGEAALWGDTCSPANDPACNPSACATVTAACTADK